MKIIVTDCGQIWNHKNPYLEKYKDIVTIVCLNGEAVSDKYACFVSPFKQVVMGEVDHYGTYSLKYQALESVEDSLRHTLKYNDDILFLADGNPESLYPFFLLKDCNDYNNLHLCVMSPCQFDRKEKREAHKFLLNDLSKLNSFCFIDGNMIVDSIRKGDTFSELIKKATDSFGKMLPRLMVGINNLSWEHYYFFDFKTMAYVQKDEGYDCIKHSGIIKEVDEIDFDIYPFISPLGIIPEKPYYPDESYVIKEYVESVPIRVDGKRICNLLREKRIQLAEVNGIKFSSAECPSIGACAGTCKKCDSELAYIQGELEKIPEEKRIYPYFDVRKEMQ